MVQRRRTAGKPGPGRFELDRQAKEPAPGAEGADELDAAEIGGSGERHALQTAFGHPVHHPRALEVKIP